jgi:hypothetical protein
MKSSLFLPSAWKGLLTIVVLFAGLIAADVFSDTDIDKDGMLNRDEFS